MRLVVVLTLALAPLPAMADPLQSLEPLLTIFGTHGKSPGWDVASIRCAQESWRQDHDGSGPSKKLLDDAANGLELSVQHRIGLGQSLTDAALSVEDDFHRVYAL